MYKLPYKLIFPLEQTVTRSSGCMSALTTDLYHRQAQTNTIQHRHKNLFTARRRQVSAYTQQAPTNELIHNKPIPTNIPKLIQQTRTQELIHGYIPKLIQLSPAHELIQ